MPRMSGADRRRQILATAVDVILKKGVAGAATRDVTQALGVGAGLLHHYFASWDSLRAEAIKLAVQREIDELKEVVAAHPDKEVFACFANWMVEDEDMRHWRLWLNAQDEAHRDDALAEVMNIAMMDWHATIRDVLERGLAGRTPVPADLAAAAWRVAAVMDGLAGAMLVKGSIMTVSQARALILSQLELEGLGQTQRQTSL